MKREQNQQKPKSSARRFFAVAAVLLVLGYVGFTQFNAETKSLWAQVTSSAVFQELKKVLEGGASQDDADGKNVADVEPDPSDVPSVQDPVDPPVEDPDPIAEVDPVSEVDPDPDPVENPELDRKRASLFPEEKSKKVTGFLNLDSTPRADKIYINGQLLTDEEGKSISTPLKKFRIPAGAHKIRLENSTFKVKGKVELKIRNDKIHNKTDIVLW